MDGGGGNVTQTQEFKPPSYTQSPTNPFWQDYVATGLGLAQIPQGQYQGMTVAPLNDVQNAGLQMTIDRAVNGAGDLNAARGSTMNIAQGAGFGPGMGANVSSAANPFAGSNTYLNQMIGNNAEDMANAFRTGTAAQNDSAAALAGSFGGGGWIAKHSADAANLAKQVGNMATQNRFQDYTTQQGLAESAINRDTSNQQFNVNAQQNAFQQGIGNVLGASQLTGQLAQDDWTAARNLTGAGDAYGAYTQSLLDASRQAYDEQMNAPWQTVDRVGNILSRASGSGNTQTSSLPSGNNPLAALGGLLGSGYAASRFFGN